MLHILLALDRVQAELCVRRENEPDESSTIIMPRWEFAAREEARVPDRHFRPLARARVGDAEQPAADLQLQLHVPMPPASRPGPRRNHRPPPRMPANSVAAPSPQITSLPHRMPPPLPPLAPQWLSQSQIEGGAGPITPRPPPEPRASHDRRLYSWRPPPRPQRRFTGSLPPSDGRFQPFPPAPRATQRQLQSNWDAVDPTPP